MSRLRAPGPRSRHPLAVGLRALWTLPTNLLGHAVGLALCRRPPRRLRSPAASGWLYAIPAGSRFDGLGAVALGHAIVHASDFLAGERGRLALAHELSHVRQHDWLGPLYLPLHALAQLASALLYLARPRRDCTPQHAYNPLEQSFLCVGFDVLRASGAPFDEATTAVLDAFGV
jgi:hypothetical protein